MRNIESISRKMSLKGILPSEVLRTEDRLLPKLRNDKKYYTFTLPLYTFLFYPMSTHAPTLHSLADLSTDIRIAFVVGEFNHHFTRQLEQANRDFLIKNGFSDITSFLVPGAFEIPGMVGRLLKTEQYDLIIAL
jgi:6,7-dimethyl-8-ribityllumazine synthase